MSYVRNKLRSKFIEFKCSKCGARLSVWDKRCSKALKTPLTCERCLAKQFDKTVDEFNDYMEGTFDMRACLGL